MMGVYRCEQTVDAGNDGVLVDSAFADTSEAAPLSTANETPIKIRKWINSPARPIAGFIAVWLLTALLRKWQNLPIHETSFAYATLAIAIMALRGAYKRRLENALVLVLIKHAIAAAFYATVSALLLGIGNDDGFSLSLQLGAVVTGLVIGEVFGEAIDRQLKSTVNYSSRALIIGTGEISERVIRRLNAQPSIGLRPIGILLTQYSKTNPLEKSPFEVPILGTYEDFPELVKTRRIDALVIATEAPSEQNGDQLDQLARQAADLKLAVFVVPTLHEMVNSRTTRQRLGTVTVDQLALVDPRSRGFQAKYAIDRVVAGLVLLFLTPLMLLIALLIKLGSVGPVLFIQTRTGLDGHNFDMLKFRTMRETNAPAIAPTEWEPEAGCAPGGIEGDDRRTRLGRILRQSHLDELPQLVNVLRGEMSFVGPRPERPEYVERFNLEISNYDSRLRVKAGMTGWAQIHGLRGQTSIRDRADWDRYYIENWSWALDFTIILHTFQTICTKND